MSVSQATSDQRIAFLRELFERFRDLPRNTADQDFRQRLSYLQTWEAEDIRRRHAVACRDDAHYTAVLGYYLSTLHNGLDLRGMLAKGLDGLENARKLDQAYPLFANAIQYSVLTAQAQDCLVETISDEPLTTETYAAALRQCDDLALREQRLDLLVEIAHQVAPHVGSRLMHTGFKMVRGIFRASGMEGIHASLDEGFRQLRRVPRLPHTMARFTETERDWLRSLVG